MRGSDKPLFWRAILPRNGGLRRSRWALALPILATAACVSMPPRAPLLADQPVFSPQAFFNGHTAGEGVLKVILSRPRRVQVDGEGQVTADGALTLRQQVTEEGKPSRNREWHLQPGRDGLFTGTLSDARGPVHADVRGNQLHVRFVTPDHLQVEQWIYLRPGGTTALNRMVVRRFGVRVAGLQETIRRVP